MLTVSMNLAMTFFSFLRTFQEWWIHKYLLHRTLMHNKEEVGRWDRKGWAGFEIHKEHHELPFYHVSIDPPWLALAWGGVFSAIVNIIMGDNPLKFSILIPYFAMGLIYEWTHFLGEFAYLR